MLDVSGDPSDPENHLPLDQAVSNLPRTDFQRSDLPKEQRINCASLIIPCYTAVLSGAPH